jgi:hypothetical protein
LILPGPPQRVDRKAGRHPSEGTGWSRDHRVDSQEALI